MSTFAISKATIPVFQTELNALTAILDKAAAYAASKKIDATVLTQTRLAPDMFPLARQVQIACDQVKNGCSRLAGVAPPRMEDTETTVDQLKERIAKTLAFLKTLDIKAFDGPGDREIVIPLGPEKKGHMKADDYVNHFLLPNFYFHLTSAYAILRHCGVDIGKTDFLGNVPMKVA